MKGGKCCGVGCLAHVLLIVGGLNWGLVGLGGFLSRDLNVLEILLGSVPTLLWVVYVLVGLSAVWALFSWSKCCGGMCAK